MSFSWFEPILYVKLGAVWLVLLTVIIILFRKKISNKHLFFLLIAIPTIIISVYLAGHTIYKNIYSVTNGPVHWHADYEIFICGEKIDLIDAKFPKNKIGSPLLHEHNDNRIHVEGTVDNLEDISLENYFKTIGGKLTKDTLNYPSNNKYIQYTSGENCPSGEQGRLKIYINGRQIENPESHILYPSTYVPPGDCIIIVFDSSNNQNTSLLCSSWEVKGWNYTNFKRDKIKIGEHEWQ